MVGYVVYYRYLKGAVVRLISCNAPLKASRLLWVNSTKYISWKSVPLGYCLGKEAVFIIVVGGGYLSVCVWVHAWLDLVWLCLGMRYWLRLMSKRLLVILYMVQSLASALLCSRVGQERAEAKVDPDVSQL